MAIGSVTASNRSALPATYAHSRFSVAWAYGIALLAYALALATDFPIRVGGTFGGLFANDLACTLASATTAVVCAVAARSLSERERLAWELIALGCVFWLASQLAWNYYELALGTLPRFPHWMQLLSIQYPLLLIAGLLTLPKPPGKAGWNVRRICNFGLAFCTLAAVAFIAIAEPAAQSLRTALSIASTLAHAGLYAAAWIVAWYLLWSYRWHTAYWPLLLIALGMSVHAGAFIFDVHGRLTGSYTSVDLANAAWVVSFFGVACAAHEFAWSSVHRPRIDLSALLVRERWLEATMPAIMLVLTGAIAAANTEWISERVIYLVSVTGLVFAVLLGVREAWVHREEHRLVNELNDSHDRLVAANAELSASEQHVRTLNLELERRVSERTAELESAYREMESFSYAVAHDIKAPLRAINGFASLLAQENAAQLDQRGKSHIERVRNGALHMSQLVDDLLAYARIERIELQSADTDLAVLIRACVDEHAEAIKQSGAEVTVRADSLAIYADPAALTLVLRNLLQNAVKFARDANPPRVTLSTERLAERVRITVIDNGIGFEMQYHDQIFALFQRLHRADQFSGTGIGLAIARKAVERMGGRLWAQSKPNEGATFFIDLPLHAKAQVASTTDVAAYRL